jgi:uncharacterized membrane protein YcfT
VSLAADESRRANAMRRMRRAEWAAYVQAALGLIASVLAAMSPDIPVSPIQTGIVALVAAALGFAVGRRHSVAAAAALVLMVLGFAVLQFVSTGKPPLLIVVAIFAWIYGRGFEGAREYARLGDAAVARDTRPI